MTAMQQAGELVAKLAEEFWRQDVYDPEPWEIKAGGENAVRCADVISTFTSACNWGPYKGNHTVEWCAMFAMYCWHRGAGLDAKWLKHFSQSTYRLWAWANYLPFDGHPNPRPPARGPEPVNYPDDFRMWIDLRAAWEEGRDYEDVVQRGDIVIVGDGTPKTGDHVTIAYSIFPDNINTISGNGGGINSKGKTNNGISAKVYKRNEGSYRPMFVVRPAFPDLKLEAP